MIHRLLVPVMAVWLGVAGCGLLPVPRSHLVRFAFVPGESGAYAIDAADSAAVFRTEGLVVKVAYRSKQALNREYPDAREGRVNLNPFTYGTQMDNDLGYAPDRFTVFEVDFNNIGRPRVQFAAQDADGVASETQKHYPNEVFRLEHTQQRRRDEAGARDVILQREGRADCNCPALPHKERHPSIRLTNYAGDDVNGLVIGAIRTNGTSFVGAGAQ